MITESLNYLTQREEAVLTELEDLHGQGIVSADQLRKAMKRQRSTPSAAHAAEASAAKAVAKEAGCVALTGTVAQKTWAESIRAQRRDEFKYINKDVAEVIALLDSSKLFIETRQMRSDEFAIYIRKNSTALLAEQETKNANKVLASAKRKSESSAKKSAAKLLERRMAFLVGKFNAMSDVPATQGLGEKIGEVEEGGASYRAFFNYATQEVRVLFKTDGPATHRVLTDEADRAEFLAIA